MNMPGDRDLRIDYMKSIAMILVMIVHSTQKVPGINKYVYELSRLGQFGCQIFFFVTGYLIYNSFTQKGLPTYKGFIKSRFIRIAPEYYIAILFYLFYNHCLVKHGALEFYPTTSKWWAIVANFMLVHGIVPNANNSVVAGGWYIGTNWLMLCIIPVLYRIYRKGKHNSFYFYPIIAAGISLFGQIVLAIILHTTFFSSRGTIVYYSFINQLPCLLAGMSACAIEKEKKELGLTIPLILCFLSGIGIIIIFYVIPDVPFIFALMPILNSAFAYGLFCLLSIGRNKLISPKAVFLKKIVVDISKASYHIYFVHFLVVELIPAYILSFFSRMGFNVNPNLIYALIILPLIGCSIVFGVMYMNGMNKVRLLVRREGNDE